MAWNWSQESSRSWGSSGRAQRLQGQLSATSVQSEYDQILRSYYSSQSQVLAEVGYAGAVVASWSAHSIATMAANQAVSQLGRLIESFAQAMATEISESQGSFVMDVYSEIALKAQRKAFQRYRETRKREGLKYRGSDPGSYQRFSDGAMERLLSEPGSLFRVTPNGIEYVIAPILDAKAPQWYRLNFGAQPADTPRVKANYIKFYDTNIPGISFESAQPSRAFSMPRGVWSSEQSPTTEGFSGLADGGDAFYPLSLMKVDKMVNLMGGNMNNRSAAWGQTGRRVTKGIVGARFLDVGAQEINRQMGPALEYIARTWVSQAAGKVVNPVSSPSPLNISKQSADATLQMLNNRLENEVSRNIKAMQEQIRNVQIKHSRMAPFRLGYGRL